MSRAVLTSICVLVCGLSLAAQESLWSYVLRCAGEGAHLEGCMLSDLSCTYDQHLAGTCGTTVPSPPPVSEPDPPSAGIAAPTALRDVGTGISAQHDGRLTDWYTLQLDGVYHTHVGMEGFVDGTVTLPVGMLESGTYRATVLACSDAAGCVSSAPLEIQR